MKKKLLSLLVAATMIGSMAGTTTVFAGEELEDVSEPVTLSLMVTTRPSSDKKDFYLDLLPELVHEKFPNITIEVEQLRTNRRYVLNLPVVKARISLLGGQRNSQRI